MNEMYTIALGDDVSCEPETNRRIPWRTTKIDESDFWFCA